MIKKQKIIKVKKEMRKAVPKTVIENKRSKTNKIHSKSSQNKLKHNKKKKKMISLLSPR